MKKIAGLMLGLSVVSLAYADIPPVTIAQQIIVQNTSNDDYQVIYNSCVQTPVDIFSNIRNCTFDKSLVLKAHSSNYQNPIIAIMSQLNQFAWVNVLRVTDLKTNIVQNYADQRCGAGDFYRNGGQNVWIISLSPLVDDPNIIMCVNVVGKK